MAGLLVEEEGGKDPPEASDLGHAEGNGRACLAVSAVDVQAGQLKGGVKESPKRKKASKMAKLKQSKLDARREQWLSQVTGKKSPPSRDSSHGDLPCHPYSEQSVESPTAGNLHSNSLIGREGASQVGSKEQSNGVNGHQEQCNGGNSHKMEGLDAPVDFNGHSIGEANRKELRRSQTQPSMRTPVEEAVAEKKSVEQVVESKEKSQRGKKKKGVRHKEGSENKDSIEEAEDWEAAAEALGVVVPENGLEGGAHSENSSHSECGASTTSEGLSPRALNGYAMRRLAPEVPDGSGRHHRSSMASAWRQDDSHRPETLPRLEKFSSFPVAHHHHTGSMWEATISRTIWGSPAPPTCPICTEELDLTDTSFVPCPCGFRLCLFCHHRIALDDGRCPGCRKAYQNEVKVEKHIQVPRSHMVRLRV